MKKILMCLIISACASNHLGVPYSSTDELAAAIKKADANLDCLVPIAYADMHEQGGDYMVMYDGSAKLYDDARGTWVWPMYEMRDSGERGVGAFLVSDLDQSNDPPPAEWYACRQTRPHQP